MIFIILGSQKFQFNRLLIEVDKLVERGYLKEEVFAQIGYSDYKPKNYKFKEFLDRDEFTNIINNSEKIITHGGTGAIIAAVKKGKKVIAVSRQERYGEHVDNHQEEIVNQFKNMGFIKGIKEISELRDNLLEIDNYNFKKYISNTENIIESIEKFITKD